MTLVQLSLNIILRKPHFYPGGWTGFKLPVRGPQRSLEEGQYTVTVSVLFGLEEGGRLSSDKLRTALVQASLAWFQHEPAWIPQDVVQA